MKPFLRGILLFGIVAFSVAAVYPCTCEIWRPQKKLRKARVVFIGELIETGTNDKDNSETVSIKFKVDRYWKGIKEPYSTVVSAPEVCCTCGLPINIGAKYLIYAFAMDNGQLETSTCMSARLDAERSQDELRILGKAKFLSH